MPPRSSAPGCWPSGPWSGGLTISGKIKTSFAPGSQAVTSYLTDTELMPYLDRLGFNVLVYGCATCIGNYGPCTRPSRRP
ncbi:hypothetical protein CRD60_01550 [Bifidobacterium aemilianum]|uniref:Aconitase/3-isopropylmalate dehydratase large subunit alpha/beta/alpha domain-containing protein n=1 Tax=Bifidobacterium aemilianum TaxID=2493120 RepID=A0A366KD17_9BIFI|nr:hypothetical protein CRD60_01550 [Bifidobacterium aemilianum]